jgi:hypothetical protein
MIVIQYITMHNMVAVYCEMKAQDRNMCTESYLEKHCDKCIMSKNELRLELCLTPFVGDKFDVWFLAVVPSTVKDICWHVSGSIQAKQCTQQHILAWNSRRWLCTIITSCRRYVRYMFEVDGVSWMK